MSLPSKSNKREIILPKLKKIDYSKKKIRYKLKDGDRRRRAAINDGVRMEQKKTGKTRKKAAIAKKGRFNILRIYRRNRKVRECKKITRDMRYIDRKYKLGKTKDICGKRNTLKAKRKKTMKTMKIRKRKKTMKRRKRRKTMKRRNKK